MNDTCGLIVYVACHSSVFDGYLRRTKPVQEGKVCTMEYRPNTQEPFCKLIRVFSQLERVTIL